VRFSSQGLFDPFASNQALERTAIRCVFTFQTIKTVSREAALAPGGRSLSCVSLDEAVWTRKSPSEMAAEIVSRDLIQFPPW
jgi:hypothetical protein